MIMPALPTGREGRVLAIGLALVAVVIVWAGGVMPLIDWHDACDAALTSRMDYERRMASIAADLPEAERAAAAAQTQSAPSAIILAGNSDPIAGAALESLIDGMTHDAQATLVSTEAMPAVQSGAFRQIGLHVTVRATWANLMNLLAAIERANPRMSIADVQIQAGPLGGAEQLLDMTFSAIAFRAGTASPGAAADDAGGAGADDTNTGTP